MLVVHRKTRKLDENLQRARHTKVWDIRPLQAQNHAQLEVIPTLKASSSRKLILWIKFDDPHMISLNENGHPICRF